MRIHTQSGNCAMFVHEVVLPHQPSATPDLDPLLKRVRTLTINSKGLLTRSGYRRDKETDLRNWIIQFWDRARLIISHMGCA
jgi:hypothetical protein